MSITSKLYNKFLELKASDNTKIYLFKSGIFYLCLNEDATKLSEIFDFKITNLNDNVTKCGFPEKRLPYYSSLLEKLNIDFEIVELSSQKSQDYPDSVNVTNFKTVVDQLITIDFDNLTFKQAFDVLYQLSQKTKKILDENT